MKEYIEDGTFEPMKDESAFQTGKGVCYVPESGNAQYRRKDFLKLAGGNEYIAEVIFDLCEWTSPATILDEFDADDGDAFLEQGVPKSKLIELEIPFYDEEDDD